MNLREQARGWLGQPAGRTQDDHLTVAVPTGLKEAVQNAAAEAGMSVSRFVRLTLIRALEDTLKPRHAPLRNRVAGDEEHADSRDPELVGTEIDHPMSGYDGWTYDDWHRFGGTNEDWLTLLSEFPNDEQGQG